MIRPARFLGIAKDYRDKFMHFIFVEKSFPGIAIKSIIVLCRKYVDTLKECMSYGSSKFKFYLRTFINSLSANKRPILPPYLLNQFFLDIY